MKISCIIPVFNEEARIAQVLDSVLGQDYITEVIVIDDGSTDNTRVILGKYSGIEVVYHEKNLGKSAAMAAGISRAQYDLVLFLDADLLGLRGEDIYALVEPVVNKRSDISLSLRANCPFLWKWVGLDYISGERVLPRSLVANNLPAIEKLRPFGFEVFVNSLIIKHKLKIAVIKWRKVRSPLKSQKYGLWTGVKKDVSMIADIFSVISLAGALHQIYKMFSLKIT